MRVKNLGGMTPSNTGNSWLAYWEKFSAQNAFMCFAAGCINRPSVGGLVQKDGSSDGKWYVIPLCDRCNKEEGPDLEIWDMANLVSASEVEALETAVKRRMPAVCALPHGEAASLSLR